ncbi:MAG: hypothetical protein Kow00128_16360 [Deltaproteobacteria bacterium]
MNPLRRIARALYPVCLEIDRTIGGHPPAAAAAFAEGNAVRHAHAVSALLEQARKAGRRSLRVLNASGMSTGHQDFSVAGYLKAHAGVPVEWTALESPRSPYPDLPAFRERAARLGIEILRADLTDRGVPFGGGRLFDAVLFTEIAEHLPLPVLLQALEAIHRHLREDGILLVTTPNLVSLPNRFRILLGNGDGPYFGDGRANRDRGLYGHIALFDVRRMGRLLRDGGFRILRSETFNAYFLESFRRSPGRRLAGLALDLLRRLVPGGGGTILIVAEKGVREPVPFQV